MSTKKESLESIRKHQADKKNSRSDSDNDSGSEKQSAEQSDSASATSTSTATVTSQGVRQKTPREILAEQNQHLAYELERARILIANKNEENAHVVGQLFDLREYIVSLERNLSFFKEQFDMKENELNALRQDLSNMFKMFRKYEARMSSRGDSSNGGGGVLNRTYDSNNESNQSGAQSSNESNSTCESDRTNTSDSSSGRNHATPNQRKSHLADSLGKIKTPKLNRGNSNEEEEEEDDEEEEEENDDEEIYGEDQIIER